MKEIAVEIKIDGENEQAPILAPLETAATKAVAPLEAAAASAMSTVVIILLYCAARTNVLHHPVAHLTIRVRVQAFRARS